VYSDEGARARFWLFGGITSHEGEGHKETQGAGRAPPQQTWCTPKRTRREQKGGARSRAPGPYASTEPRP